MWGLRISSTPARLSPVMFLFQVVYGEFCLLYLFSVDFLLPGRVLGTCAQHPMPHVALGPDM